VRKKEIAYLQRVQAAAAAAAAAATAKRAAAAAKASGRPAPLVSQTSLDVDAFDQHVKAEIAHNERTELRTLRGPGLLLYSIITPAILEQVTLVIHRMMMYCVNVCTDRSQQ
jgi:hypothetical protein